VQLRQHWLSLHSKAVTEQSGNTRPKPLPQRRPKQQWTGLCCGAKAEKGYNQPAVHGGQMAVSPETAVAMQ